MEGRIRTSRFAKEYTTRFLTALARIRRGKVSAELKAELRRNSRAKVMKISSELSAAMTERGSSGREWRRSILAQHTKNSPTFVHFIRTCGCSMKFNNKRSSQWRRNLLGGRRVRRRSHKWSVSYIEWMRRVVAGATLVDQNKEQASVETLKSLIPGGRGMDTVLVLEETIDYIQALQMQLHSLKTLGFSLFSSN
ncbi:hypothetical protein SUGI_0193990 [Cryptomeria japonica]|nr:hypothetical protein SUGI_0193990 [Cryptomeria japonica]